MGLIQVVLVIDFSGGSSLMVTGAISMRTSGDCF